MEQVATAGAIDFWLPLLEENFGEHTLIFKNVQNAQPVGVPVHVSHIDGRELEDVLQNVLQLFVVLLLFPF